jgi:hypothetical protein
VSPARQVALIVGFDRCGSSMIAKVLAAHPDIGLVFQPFNSTEVHRAQWRSWPPEVPRPATERFLRGLLAGTLDRDYIASDWLDNHSRIAGDTRLDIVKDTKLHFQLPWLAARVPEIPVYGIWREPRAIVASLMRNEFHQRWYGNVGRRELADIIDHERGLDAYGPMLGRPLAEHERMALIVAVRTHALVSGVPGGRWLVYEDIVTAPNERLGELCADFGLSSFDFAPHTGVDQNVIGKPYAGADLWRAYFDDRQRADLDRVFAPLEELWRRRRP